MFLNLQPKNQSNDSSNKVWKHKRICWNKIRKSVWMDRLITTVSRVEAAGKIGATRKFIMICSLSLELGRGR